MPQQFNMSIDCCFCNEISTNRIPNTFMTNCSLKSRIVYSTQNFVVIPSVAPLVEGHVLLLPKNHVTSLAQIAESNKEEFHSFLQFIYAKVDKVWNYPIIFEHGVGKGKTGGCGVTHAHLHIVPISSAHKSSLWSSILQEIGDFRPNVPLRKTLNQLRIENSYLLIGDGLMQTTCCVKDDLPSQLMRRLIANTLSLPNWNWRQMSNWSCFESTYYKLKNVA